MDLNAVVQQVAEIVNVLDILDQPERVELLNKLRLELHRHSPFKNDPVDCVQWVLSTDVQANDYNPNVVAPPEMKLLEHSVAEDGYTQPIVAWQNDDGYEVVDGFHRHRVGQESKLVRERVFGYLPLTVINQERTDRSDRIASTIRHNRARGKHRIDAMAEIVIELKRRNWSDTKIGDELGMDPDEVLRLSQITGLAEMFNDHEFSRAWMADMIDEDDTLEMEVEEDLSPV